MEKIKLDPEKWYTTSQVTQLGREGYIPVKSLSSLYTIIHEGKLKIVARGNKKKQKFFIQGKELQRFSEGLQSFIK